MADRTREPGRRDATTAKRRSALTVALAGLTRLAGWKGLDRWGLRDRTHRAAFVATRTGFRTAAAVGRAFPAARAAGDPARLQPSGDQGLFDLTPTEEQRLISGTAAEFAADRLRPAAAEADANACAPPRLLAAGAELGLVTIGVPEQLGGAATERSEITSVLVTERLGHGDPGLALACLAPAAVGTALSRWGDAWQQATYLPAFVGDRPPAAALAIQEPTPLFDPFRLRTTARRNGGGFVLDGVKSLVPRAAEAELFVVAADLEGKPVLLLVEPAGLTVEAEPAMGLRAAGLGRILLDGVKLPAGALLGTADWAAGNGAAGNGAAGNGAAGAFVECVRLARLAWCALAVGTAQAVLDYVIPYVNQREAFGEPISHRQAVAFTVADMATETDGLRLVTYRAASRAAQGLPFGREVALARRLCAERAMRVGSDGVQLLGGHGYVKEHPVQRWYRDLRATGLMEGGLLA